MEAKPLVYVFTFCSLPDITEEAPVLQYNALLTGMQWYLNFAFTISSSSSRSFSDLDEDKLRGCYWAVAVPCVLQC